MASQHMHIISFDVPYPANYGGVIDVFYKLKTFHEQGIKIHLHCFEYGRKEADALNELCEVVYYYKRNIKKSLLLNQLPFIVISRSSELLLQNLLRDNHPILFEGLHTCFYLKDERLKHRIKLVRTHNIEHDYYQGLANVEKHTFKKIYFKEEARKLKKFEAVLHHAASILAISKMDTIALSEKYKKTILVGPFHAYDEVEIKTGMGDYCLYHGNLEVGENNEAALYLVNEVFSKTQKPLIIAGNKPTPELKKTIAQYKHIQLITNIGNQAMLELIQNAQINILPTFQTTGIKLKLLNALFNGRHCIVNDAMVVNTELATLCSVKNTAEEMRLEIERLFYLPVNSDEKEKRETILLTHFSNESNGKKIIDLIE